MTHDRQGHHRQTIRLPGYDYRLGGWYYVTLVTQGRECVFDNSLFRTIAETLWLRLPQFFPRLILDEWVLMPDHLHAILILTGDAQEVPALANGAPSGSLGAMIGNYKSVTTRKLNVIRKLEGRQLWQRNYYEHIIRSEPELDALRGYIRDNPVNLALDIEYPDRLPTW